MSTTRPGTRRAITAWGCLTRRGGPCPRGLSAPEPPLLALVLLLPPLLLVLVLVVLVVLVLVLHLALVVAVMPVVLLLVAVGLPCARGRGELRMHGLFFCTEHRPASIRTVSEATEDYHL